MRKHETAVCGTARTVVWEVGKCENRRQMPFMINIYLLPDLSYFTYLSISLLFLLFFAGRGMKPSVSPVFSVIAWNTAAA